MKWTWKCNTSHTLDLDAGRKSLCWSLSSQGISLENVLERRQMDLRANKDVVLYRKVPVSAGI